MPRVLIIDRDPVSRKRAADALRGLAGIEIAAYESPAALMPPPGDWAVDAVLIDLQEHLATGRNWLAALSRHNGALPVILTTQPGQEASAVRELRAGAVTYLPKADISRDLPLVVGEVLAVRAAEHHPGHPMDFLTSSELNFELENDPALTAPLIGHLLEMLAIFKICDEPRRIRVGIALQEALSNAIFHGNLEIDSEIRRRDVQEFYSLAQRRRRLAPWRDRRVHMTARCDRNIARWTIRDEGPGFDASQVPDPTDPAHVECPTGRGLLLMRTFMDRVIYNAAGNQVVMEVDRSA
jgi:anti-sigma regulatory factor (Ser/Thr protein kinase)/ActR/RegA family two-component response regulator